MRRFYVVFASGALAYQALGSLGNSGPELQEQFEEPVRGKLQQMSGTVPTSNVTAPSRDTLICGMCVLVLGLILARNCAEKLGRKLSEKEETASNAGTAGVRANA